MNEFTNSFYDKFLHDHFSLEKIEKTIKTELLYKVFMICIQTIFFVFIQIYSLIKQQ